MAQRAVLYPSPYGVCEHLIGSLAARRRRCAFRRAVCRGPPARTLPRLGWLCAVCALRGNAKNLSRDLSDCFQGVSRLGKVMKDEEFMKWHRAFVEEHCEAFTLGVSGQNRERQAEIELKYTQHVYAQLSQGLPEVSNPPKTMWPAIGATVISPRGSGQNWTEAAQHCIASTSSTSSSSASSVSNVA